MSIHVYLFIFFLFIKIINLQINMNQIWIDKVFVFSFWCENFSLTVSMTDSVHFHCTYICDDCAEKFIIQWLEKMCVANDVRYRISFDGGKLSSFHFWYPSFQCIGWLLLDIGLKCDGKMHAQYVPSAYVFVYCFVNVLALFSFFSIGMERQCFSRISIV